MSTNYTSLLASSSCYSTSSSPVFTPTLPPERKSLFFLRDEAKNEKDFGNLQILNKNTRKVLATLPFIRNQAGQRCWNIFPSDTVELFLSKTEWKFERNPFPIQVQGFHLQDSNCLNGIGFDFSRYFSSRKQNPECGSFFLPLVKSKPKINCKETFRIKQALFFSWDCFKIPRLLGTDRSNFSKQKEDTEKQSTALNDRGHNVIDHWLEEKNHLEFQVIESCLFNSLKSDKIDEKDIFPWCRTETLLDGEYIRCIFDGEKKMYFQSQKMPKDPNLLWLWIPRDATQQLEVEHCRKLQELRTLRQTNHVESCAWQSIEDSEEFEMKFTYPYLCMFYSRWKRGLGLLKRYCFNEKENSWSKLPEIECALEVQEVNLWVVIKDVLICVNHVMQTGFFFKLSNLTTKNKAEEAVYVFDDKIECVSKTQDDNHIVFLFKGGRVLYLSYVFALALIEVTLKKVNLKLS